MALDDGEDAERDERRRANRERMIGAGMGVTGVDYAIAETGSAVIVARQGASRLVSLLPPVHVAIVERGQALPSLDELFALLRERYGAADFESYMNIITGPEPLRRYRVPTRNRRPRPRRGAHGDRGVARRGECTFQRLKSVCQRP